MFFLFLPKEVWNATCIELEHILISFFKFLISKYAMHLKIVQLNNLPRMRLKYQEVRRQMERKAICRKEERVKKKEKE